MGTYINTNDGKKNIIIYINMRTSHRGGGQRENDVKPSRRGGVYNIILLYYYYCKRGSRSGRVRN